MADPRLAYALAMHGMRISIWVLVAAVAWGLLGSMREAHAQPTGSADEVASGVTVTVSRFDVGYAGRVRAGDWTPMRVVVTNASAVDRDVVVTWRLSDDDGDTALMQRQTTVNAGREQAVWLYGALPMDLGLRPQWEVMVTDAQSGVAVARAQVAVDAQAVVPTTRQLIGVHGAARSAWSVLNRT